MKVAHVLPTLAACAPPSTPPCKFETASSRLATHLARKNIYTHVCSQPYKSPGPVTWQREHRQTAAPPFLPGAPAGPAGARGSPRRFGPISQVGEMVTDPRGLALPSTPPLSAPQPLGNSSSDPSPRPEAIVPARAGQGAGGIADLIMISTEPGQLIEVSKDHGN